MTNKRAAGTEDVLIGSAIRRVRRMRDLSQTGLANELGISFQQVQKYERGLNRLSATRLAEVARVLSCEISDLIAGAHEIAPPPEPLYSRDAMRVAEAFDTIKDPRQQRSLLKLTLAIAAKTKSDAPAIQED